MTTLKAPTSHYYCTRRQAAKAPPPRGILTCPISWDQFSVEKFKATSIIPSKYAGSIKFDVKRLQKTLFPCRDCWRIGINLIVAMLKHKRNRKFDFQYKINFFHSWTPKVMFSLVAPPLVKILLLEFIRWNKNRSYTEKVKYPLFIPSSEFNAYLKQIKVVLTTVKKYRIFSLVTNTIYIFHCSKQRHFRQFRAKFLPEKVRNALFESDVTLRMYARQIKLMTPHFYVTFELT